MPYNQAAFLRARPDLANNWNNANDPTFRAQNPNDQNVQGILNYGSLDNYLSANYEAMGSPDLPTTPDAPIVQAPDPVALTNPGPAVATDVPGQNFNQNQKSNQFGQYVSQGDTTQQQQQVTGNDTTQQQKNVSGSNTVNQQNQVTGNDSTTNQKQTTGSNTVDNIDSTTSTNGTTTSTPLDTLGFGALLKGQQGTAVASDAARNGFLTDLVQTGGNNLNSQFDQASRNALTGAQMTGAGDSARARAAGYAQAEIARKNTGDRLNAAGQLAGPTAVTQLSSAANPFIGSSTATTGTIATKGTNTSNTTGFSNLVGSSSDRGFANSTGSSNTNGFSNTDSTSKERGFSNLVGSTHESGSGTATGTGSQSAAGLVPQTQQQSSGGGGCVLCTAAIELGLSKHHRVLRVVIRHKLEKDWPRFRNSARGYFFLFTPLARTLLSFPKVASVLWPVAKAVVYEELRVAGRRLPPRTWARLVHWSGHYLCAAVGRLPFLPGYVTDNVIMGIARREKINFEVQS